MSETRKILILGGGFGGIRCALDLSKKIGSEAEITLIDKKSYHLFVPALYEVASAYGVKKDSFAVRLKKTICIPYSDIFEDKKINPHTHFGQFLKNIFLPWQKSKVSVGVNFIQAEVFNIDLENKKVVTRGGEILDYDYLVIALGGQAADFGISGVRDYAFQFKELENALALNQKIEELIKEVVSGVRSRSINPVVDFPIATESPKEFRKIHYGVKIAVVGAGFSGIEVAAEFACCVKALSNACGINGRCERIMLLEAGSRILPTVSDDERDIILKRLTRLGIEVMQNAAVEEVGGDHVKLKNGKRLDVDVVIWTAGIRLPDLLAQTLDLPLTEKSKIKVNNGLEVIGLSDVFAVGYNTEFIDSKTGKPIPALAYVAADQGKIAAKNILRILKSKPLISYNPFYSVWIAPIGGKYALAHLWGGINIKGFWGWVIRELVDFKYLLSILPFKKAISIMWQEITLFTKND